MFVLLKSIFLRVPRHPSIFSILPSLILSIYEGQMYFKLTDNLLHSTLLPIVRTTLSQLLLNNFFFQKYVQK